MLLLLPTAGSAQGSGVGSASRSDSINVLHTRIELDLSNTAAGLIHGDATLTFAPRVQGITHLPVDLMLPVDSVVMNGLHLPYSQAGEVLLIDLQSIFGPEDTLAVTISYGGDPVTDPSGFGGFYTLPSYQYDLGVAFDAVPHSFGRAWFPCFDNFVERSSFDFIVRTTNGRSVFASGALQQITEMDDGGRITHWRLEEPVPSYLASVAAGNYAAIHDTFPSLSGADVPVILAALPGDTAQMRASFFHLKDAFDSFEQWFGPYRWNRVGYVLTSAGAMEHATNICYPDFAADGTLANEDLIAHELSHHWFGNLITCATAEEMYINEGFADFCAMLFIEGLYGEGPYKARVRANHRRVVSSAHLRDAGWYALAAVPQNATYGETTYKKGADVARTLRAVMGDSLFSTAMKRLFANNGFSAMGTHALRDSLGEAAGMDLTDFFNNWILQPGGAAFMVDSFSTGGDPLQTQVFIRQKTRGGAALFHDVPVSVTCIGSDGQQHRELAILDGEQSIATVSTPFLPVAVRLNDDDRLALATTWDTLTVTTTGQKNFSNTDLVLHTSAISAPAHLRVEELWVPADPAEGFQVSPDRWWRIENNAPPGTEMTLRFTVDGRPGMINSFDQGLVQSVGGVVFHEDSLVVLYRPAPGFAWQAKPSTVNSVGSATDGNARVDISGVAPGDYVVAWRTLPMSLTEVGTNPQGWTYFPDPASDRVTVVAPDDQRVNGAKLVVRDMGGRVLHRQRLRAGANHVQLSRLPAQPVVLAVQYPDGASKSLGHLRIIH
ncbi:MAG: M1 family metallopeptidase [Flavobacteriales bacterium]|nr:M1 family metallopeptidase [Flavobacteriales bacterium]